MWRCRSRRIHEVAQTRVGPYMCPSEENDRARHTPTLTYYPLNYCLNEGTWFIYDPVSDEVGDGAFAPNRAFKTGQIADGLSRTWRCPSARHTNQTIGTPETLPPKESRRRIRRQRWHRILAAPSTSTGTPSGSRAMCTKPVSRRLSRRIRWCRTRIRRRHV